MVKILKTDEFINEGRFANMKDTEWLNTLYCGYANLNARTYIQPLYDRVQNFAMYGVFTEDVDKQKERLKQNGGITRFRVVTANDKHFSIICFLYNPKKDKKRQEALQGEAEKERVEFENFRKEVNAVDTTKYSASEKDVEKMKEHLNKGIKPSRLVSLIKDPNKLVNMWLAAIEIGWKDAISEFSYKILSRKILSKAEITAYSEKYKQKQHNK